MKKFFATILAFLYLATTTGATINVHYCMGKLYSVDLVAKDKCDKCGMKKAKGCCEDKVKVVKVQDSHQLVSQAIGFQPHLADLPKNYMELVSACRQVTLISTLHNNSPPGTSPASLCILYCVFRL